MRKRISVISENTTGRNESFLDNFTNIQMTRNQFVKKIENGYYEKYHVRKINNLKIPVSNPDNSKNNNLG